MLEHDVEERLLAADGCRGVGIPENLVMPSSVHIPKLLLEAAHRRARTLRASGSRLVAKALERELAGGDDSSPDFFERLGAVDEATARAVDELLSAIRAVRTLKKPRHS